MFYWMLLPLSRYMEFSGRSRRKEYWSFFLLNMIVLSVIMAFMFSSGSMLAAMGDAARSGNPLAIYGAMFSGVGILIAIWWLFTLIPNIAVNVRRLHDRDMSGWWYLGFIVGSMIPLLNLIVGIAFLVIMFREGTHGANRFGPDPKDPTSAEVFA